MESRVSRPNHTSAVFREAEPSDAELVEAEISAGRFHVGRGRSSTMRPVPSCLHQPELEKRSWAWKHDGRILMRPTVAWARPGWTVGRAALDGKEVE